MKVQEVVEKQELLETAYLPLFSMRAIHKTLARPYYFRWRSSVEGSAGAAARRESALAA
ncbi:MAG: hypothetical protein MUP40_06665 [Actinobacteria bacterium]|nr:hypothetical protein [Actinomycetota bacterium]